MTTRSYRERPFMFVSSHKALSAADKCLRKTSLALYVYYMLFETASNPQICLECDSAPTRANNRRGTSSRRSLTRKNYSAISVNSLSL